MKIIYSFLCSRYNNKLVLVVRNINYLRYNNNNFECVKLKDRIYTEHENVYTIHSYTDLYLQRNRWKDR